MKIECQAAKGFMHDLHFFCPLRRGGAPLKNVLQRIFDGDSVLAV